ncbi:MAG: TM0106 family RecB-like putative nuclease [Actinomycetota bacterium]|nr:TM0106 family RecB-like putative nuclease [Actinomycetota bacterium]
MADHTLLLSASDLNDFLACGHLTQQRLAIARGERAKPRPVEDPHAALIRERGVEFEGEQLQRLAEDSDGWVDLSGYAELFTDEALTGAAAETAQAMWDGAPLIYQGVLYDGRWQGRVDFLRRVARPSELGAWSYEALDTKLSRHSRPEYVNQMSLYSRLLERVQGVSPAVAHILLGDGREEMIELRRYAALHRHLTDRLNDVVKKAAQETYPEPVAHCGICALSAECDSRRRRDDHLSLVAGAHAANRDALVAAGITTVRALAGAPEDSVSRPLARDRFLTLHRQAELQVISRETNQPTHRHVPPSRAAGYARLPEADPGDLFFDLEGDPFLGDGGIEYLWGWCDADGAYECFWAHSAAEEKWAFEQFVDLVTTRRVEHPSMKVFHYAPHERSKLRSLSIQYATRESQVDELLRGEVFVDLFAVVRQGIQVGEESYSLKRLERHYGYERREKRVRDGGGSIVAYETWLRAEDAHLLNAIRAYNSEDCRSTLALRNWLQDAMVPEAAREFGVDFGSLREPEPEDPPHLPQWLPEVERRADALMEGLSVSGDDDLLEEAERRLLAHLLLYHHRENKPHWWRYFDLRGKPIEELVDDRDAIAGIILDETVAPVPDKRSLLYRLNFEPQEHRLSGGQAQDPTTGETFDVVDIGIDYAVVRRGATKPAPRPEALVATGPINTGVLREALVVLADLVLDDRGRDTAPRRLLRRGPPDLESGRLGETTDELIGATLGLRSSVLPVQGPPGTGKTYNGALMITAALTAGQRVGVTAFSHAAIQNLLHAVENHAHETGVEFQGAYKRGTPYASRHGLIEEVDSNGAVNADHDLVAGTAWLFSRPEHRGAFDRIFIDEAGQYSLANAAAIGLAADGLVLLGDPQQLPQVTQAPHPSGAGASVLEHLLDGADTIAADRGVLLTESWRMHPDVCAFVSERSYDSKLHARDACAKRRVDAPGLTPSGAGLRTLPVFHADRSQHSPEEASAIVAACEALLSGSTVTDEHGAKRPLLPSDILVVAPYNMAVQRIADAVRYGVRVGTVDRFQGQEAPVVFYAMTCSSGADAPRGLDFLFDRNRLNVAVSRAQSLAILVYSPQLLDSPCPTIEAMALVDGVCRFVEMAIPLTIGSGGATLSGSRGGPKELKLG